MVVLTQCSRIYEDGLYTNLSEVPKLTKNAFIFCHLPSVRNLLLTNKEDIQSRKCVASMKNICLFSNNSWTWCSQIPRSNISYFSQKADSKKNWDPSALIFRAGNSQSAEYQELNSRCAPKSVHSAPLRYEINRTHHIWQQNPFHNTSCICKIAIRRNN